MSIISVIQYKPRLASCAADISDNIRKAIPLIHSAGELGSEIVVLPELCFTGYAHIDLNSASLLCELRNGSTYQKMAKLSQDLSCYIAYGFMERHNSKLYNSANLIGPNGDLLTTYRKRNLWANDFLWANPGANEPEILSTTHGGISLLICRDLRSKSPPHQGNEPIFHQKKPDVVLACANWGKSGFPPTNWMDFCKRNECMLAVANNYGIEENQGYVLDFGCGGSSIIDKNWKVKSSGLIFNKNCVVTCNTGA
jgi:predicted amidohydrolase